MIRPLTFVTAYFLAIIMFAAADGMSNSQWVTLDQWHDVLAAFAGLSFAFKNDPADKAAMVALVAYTVLLATFDWIIPHVYGPELCIVGSLFIGWIFYIRREANASYNSEGPGRDA